MALANGHSISTMEAFSMCVRASPWQMHCSQPQQAKLAKTAVEQLGSLLLPVGLASTPCFAVAHRSP